MINEKREHIREIKYLNVVCRTLSGEVMEITTRNVSESAIALSILKKYHNLQVGEKVEVKIKDHSTPNFIAGEVLRVLDHMIVIKFYEKQRLAERLKGQFMAKCTLPEKDIILHTRDFSDTGVFILFDKKLHKLKLNEEIDVELFLPEDFLRTQKCQIVRIENDGIALKFIK